MCFEEAFKYSLVRKTFGKPLVSHQIIRYKLAEMAKRIESLYDSCERIAYQYKRGVPDSEMGGPCALVKVQASQTFDFCAREASQIFGGSSIVKEGQGKIVERLYRQVRATAIPGGAEEILVDFAIRQAVAKYNKTNLTSKL
jgi:alkylation response protein AidB-like acyl-CoA dehydrogenase